MLRRGDGSDSILDFEDEIDSLLLDGLTLENINVTAGLDNSTLIQTIDTEELLATLVGVSNDQIGQDDFMLST